MRLRARQRDFAVRGSDPVDAMRELIAHTFSALLEHREVIALLNSENLHKGRHVQRSRRVHKLHGPLVETLRAILRRGERDGLFRAGIDPVQLYISIAGEGYFYLSNRYTLSRIFERDLMAPRALAGRARHITQTILNSVRR